MDREELAADEAFDLDEILRLIDGDLPSEEEARPEPAPAPEDQAPQAEESAEDTAATEGTAEHQPETAVSEKTEKQTKPEEKKEDPKKSVVLYLRDLCSYVLAVLVIFLLCFRMVVVSGGSMYDTLVDGDYLLLLSNVFYHEPKQGDIIVFSKDSFREGEAVVKRVIATEGQKVDIDFGAGIVYVDGVALEEDYIYTPTALQEGVNFPLVVDEGCVFVMGDNRMDSLDSRNPEIGLVDRREILGRAIFLLIPGTNSGNDDRDFGRIGVLS